MHPDHLTIMDFLAPTDNQPGRKPYPHWHKPSWSKHRWYPSWDYIGDCRRKITKGGHYPTINLPNPLTYQRSCPPRDSDGQIWQYICYIWNNALTWLDAGWYTYYRSVSYQMTECLPAARLSKNITKIPHGFITYKSTDLRDEHWYKDNNQSTP